MASEIRVNTINNRSGLGTVNFTDSGVIVSGVATANAFSGDLTGNVTGDLTGNVTGNVTGNATGLSGSPTLTGITSISTTNLTVNGNAYPNAGPLSNRNLVINGAMTISQRGTSFTNMTTSGVYGLDRFQHSISSAGTWTISQSSNAPDGFRYSHRAECTTSGLSGTGSYISLSYKFEAQDVQHLGHGTSSAKQTTLSFWVRSSTTGNYTAWMYKYDGGRSISKTFAVNASDTWEYKTIVFDADTTDAIANDNTPGILMRFYYAAGSDYTSGTQQTSWGVISNADICDANQVNLASTVGNYIEFTGVQLEVGTVATPFEHRSYGDELARCRRYYYKIQAKASNTSGFFANAHNRSATSALGVTQFPVEMRTSPTALEQSGTASDYAVNHGNTQTACSSVPAWFEADTFAARTNFTTAGSLTDGQGSILRSASTDAYLAWSAEL